MRYAIFSDVHANLEAFQAVLEAVQVEAPDKYVFLGDIVGYGASPNAVTDMIRDLKPLVGIRGNHDKVVIEVEDGENFRGYAKHAALWTRERLSITNRRFLESLPKGPVSVDEQVLICHGSPHDEDYYILTETDAVTALLNTQYWLTFFGHTHVPFVGYLSNGRQLKVEYPNHTQCIKLLEEHRYLINPGSVGQPRDHNPYASFVILDTDEHFLIIHRIPYNIKKAQEKILAAGLDPFLAERLSQGR